MDFRGRRTSLDRVTYRASDNVTTVSTPFGPVPKYVWTLLLLLVAVAMLAGLYGRFKGIGTWPLGVDEFYSARSIDQILLTGWPRFLCGGYYTRGLIFQYVVAGVRWCGLSSEFAGRFVTGICSLAVLPAAYRIGSRTQGPLIGWLVVIILALSVWEIEMARFIRMYAPFQAVFSWYLVFYLRYTVDKSPAAMRWMIVLSVIGVFTWEGGVILGLANLFAIVQAHERGRLRAAEWRRLAGMFLLLLALLFLATRDLRRAGGLEIAAVEGGPKSHFQFVVAWLEAVRRHPRWALGFLLPLGIAAGALRWIWSRRREWLTAGGLCAALVSAAAHQFTLTAGVLALMLLMRLIDWRELSARSARWFLLALLAFFVFWLAFAQFSDHRLADAAVRGASGAALPAALQYLFGFPNVYDDIVRPWGRTVPVLSLELFVAIGYLFWKAVAVPWKKDDPIAVLLGLLIMMLLAVGAMPTDRIETRYTFFLYPLAIVLAVSAPAILAQGRRVSRYAPFLALAPLLCFGATEDFQPWHIKNVDSAQVNFRIGMPTARAEHYYSRSDMGGVARWLAANVRPGDIVITGIPNLDPYYHAFDYFYLNEGDRRNEAYICADGRTERWTNHPVVHRASELKSSVVTGHRVYAIVYSDVEDQLRREVEGEGWHLTRAWTAADGQTDVLAIAEDSAAPSTH